MVADLNALGAAQGYGQVAKATTNQTSPIAESAKEAATEFAKTFDNADNAVQALAEGQGSAQAVVEAMAQAELALQTAVTIRDRVVEAYQEIIRMPL